MGKFSTFGNNPDTICRKIIAKQQNTETFRNGAATLLRHRSANFRLGSAGK
jgi:hypothetical protein